MAYSFTAASSQYLTTISTPVSSGPFTISAFGTIAATALTVKTLISIESGNSNILYQLYVDGNQNLKLYCEGSSGSGTNTIATTIATNTPFHAAAVINSSSNRLLYLNGFNTNLNIVNIGTTNVSRINIGSRYYAGSLGGYQIGRIAEVGIWNAALTAAEIASLAKGMTCDKVRPQSLVFYAPLVRDLIDQKGGLTITNNNGATVANHLRVYA
jgi:hypothetical protein